MDIIGFCFLKNEDIYIERVLKNIIDFCDKIIIIDNNSTDNTFLIVKKYSEIHKKIKIYQENNIKNFYNYVKKFIGKNVWAFSVDGDEIYDVEGLKKIREGIKNGMYQDNWMLRGYFFHLISIDMKNMIGEGYLAPPAKDPNKLYNMSLLKSWETDGGVVFHAETKVFKSKKYNDKKTPPLKMFHKEFKWEECPLKCVHTRMLKRSSTEKYDTFINARLNMTDELKKRSPNFREKYRIGEIIKKDISMFFKD